jgi:hypothetical protein
MSRRARWMALAAVVLAGCGASDQDTRDYSDIPTGPIDRPYIATVRGVDDQCSLNPAKVDQVGEVDVRARFDGLIDLISWKAPFPGQQVQLDGIAVGDDGSVNHESSYTSSDGREHPYRVSGYLFPSLLDLTLEHTDENDCPFRIRLEGVPRLLHDQSALDGFYAWQMTSLGVLCPGEPRPVPAEPDWNAIVDIRHFSDQLELVLDRGLVFTMEVPETDGPLKHEGQATDAFSRPSEMTWVTFDGRLTAGEVAGVITVGFIDPANDICPAAFDVVGHKLVPSATALGGIYRAEYSVTNTCPQEEKPGSYSYYDTIVALFQPDNSLRIFDTVGIVDLVKRSDGSYRYQAGGPYSMVTYTASFDLPNLNYQVLMQDYGSDGATCELKVEARAVKRFLDTDEPQEV